MRIVFALALLAAAVLIPACQKAETPEEVVRKWQSHFDNNEFEKARKLSAPRTVQFLAWMEALHNEMSAGAGITQTEMKDLRCRETGDHAVCYYVLEEEGEVFRDSITLVRYQGRWLVDLPDEPAPGEEVGLDEIFDMMDQDTI